MESTNTRFRVKSYGDDFVTGHCDNGDQVLMGLLCPEVVLYRFAPTGEFLRREAQDWEYPAPRVGGIFQISDPTFRRRLAQQIASWQREIGFVDAPIDVNAFFDHEHLVGLSLPEDQECSHVLWWAKDYWLKATGDVQST
jgi:hypothetical protein